MIVSDFSWQEEYSLRLQEVENRYGKAWAKVSLLSLNRLVNLPAKPFILRHDSILQKFDSIL